MPNVTVTIRELKNKDTGLDLTIPVFSEKSHLFGKTAECNVVVVSRLAYFKLPEHKESDIVQFSVTKQMEDFGELWEKLAARFPGTVLPQLPKSLFSFTVGTAKQQVALLESFLQFVARTTKMATCTETLNFLGFSSVRKGLGTQSKSYRNRNTLEDSTQGAEGSENLFDDANSDADEDDLFGISPSSDTKHKLNPATRLFDDQDYGGKVSKDDELVRIVGATDASPSNMSNKHGLFDNTEDEELLNIEDDLTDLLTLKPKSSENPSMNENNSKRQQINTKSLKPKPDTKPKPKPRLPPKPATAEKGASFLETPGSNSAESSSKKQEVDNKMDTEDILKYIQSNSECQDDDLDLFS